MSVRITIRQKGLMKRTLPLNEILMDEFSYGRYDQNFVLEVNEKRDDELTVFHQDHIARGISVIWNEKEKNEISLHMLLPTTKEEINDLYELVEHICCFWKTNTFIQDEETYTLQDIPHLKEEQLSTSYHALKQFLNEHDKGSFFCAMWPIYFESKEMMHWVDDVSLDNFAQDLHHNQNQDLYYANARFYQVQNPDAIMGVYTVSATVDTIFPLKPMIPFSCMNLKTGERIEADYYRVALVSIAQDKMLGMISFDDFMKVLMKKEVHEFDSEHIYFDGFSEEEIQKLYDDYHL